MEPPPEPDPTAERPECGKIDFLFVIDNSGSMEEEQTALIASFAGFMQGIQNVTKTNDFHVMVVDSDSYCAPEIKMENHGWCPPPKVNGPSCDQMMGAGRIANGKTGESCNIAGGRRYMTSEQADYAAAFACAANVGTTGDGDEAPMESMYAALSALNGAGACNEGFLRDDALLVVTIIADEDDDNEDQTGRCCPAPDRPNGKFCVPGSFGGANNTPEAWFQRLVPLKGTEQNIVVLSVVGLADNPCPGAAGCSGLPTGAQTGLHFLDFTKRFTHGAATRICDLNYSQFFANSVMAVDQACRSYVPPR